MSIKSFIFSPIKKKIKNIINSFLGKKENKEYRKVTKKALSEFTILWKSSEICLEKVCYFSTYDKDSIVDEYVFYYLEQVKKSGFKIVVIVSSSYISKDDLKRLKLLTIAIIHRSNYGLDFFSWKIGIEAVPINDNMQKILFANDSVYGPFEPLDTYFEKMENIYYDAVGMTDSWEFNYHMQSYFLYIKKNIIKSGILQQFFSSVEVQPSKQKIVMKYEVGFSQLLMKYGFKIGALAEYLNINNIYSASKERYDYKYRYNQNIVYWDILVKFRYIPFLKRNIFPTLGIENISPIEFLKRHLAAIKSEYKIQMIEDHMKREL